MWREKVVERWANGNGKVVILVVLDLGIGVVVCEMRISIDLLEKRNDGGDRW